MLYVVHAPLGDWLSFMAQSGVVPGEYLLQIPAYLLGGIPAVIGFQVAMEHAGMLILASATQPKQQVTLNGDAADALPLPPGFSVDVGYPESVTEIHARALAQGSTIIEPLEDKPIGIRRFSLLDPNGTRVTIVAHLDEQYQPPR